jgi:uncharacterized membrane protein YeaQ/YmgE (transglycosylase-associated protein family)
MNLVSWVIVGAIAGWLGGQIMRGRGFGCIGNIVIGLVGAVIGGFVFQKLQIELAFGVLNEVVTALVGAVILLGIANILLPQRR